MNKIKTNNIILLGLSSLFILISPFTLEGFVLEIFVSGIFYKQYRNYCKECKPKTKVSDTISNYGLVDMK